MHGAASSAASPSGVQGICPDGWHVPSDAEWATMTDCVGQSDYKCSTNSENIAKALASSEGWNTDTSSCAVVNTPASNNATGFSAVPAGNCYGSSFGSAGNNANFWSTTQNESDSNNAYNRNLNYNNANVNRGNNKNKNRNNGMAVALSLLQGMPELCEPARIPLSPHDVRLPHINLLHQTGAEPVQLLVERLLLAFVEGRIGTAVLFEEIVEGVFGKQPHHFAEILREM